MNTLPVPLHGDRAWIAQHRAELQRHVAQCWTRHAWLTASQFLDSVHEQLGRRFATTVFVAAVLMELLVRWS